MTDEQIIAVYKMLKVIDLEQPFSMTAEQCRAALLAQYPGHQTVEAIFETGDLSMEWRAEAYVRFGVEP